MPDPATERRAEPDENAPLKAGSSRLLSLPVERPAMMLALALVTVLVALFFAQKLGLRTSFGELLPENKESVIVAEQVSRHLPSVSTLMVVGEGKDAEGLKRFADALGKELSALDPNLVASVEIGVHGARDFFERQQALYAPLDLLQEIHDEIAERYDYEVQKRADLLVVDEPPPPLIEASIRERLRERSSNVGGDKSSERYPGGYYLDAKEPTVVIALRTPISGGDLERSTKLKGLVWAAIERLGPERFDPSLKIGLTGNLVTSQEEYSQIKGDLTHVGFLGVCLIAGVVFLFYLRVRTLLAMLLTVGIGTVWTFGLAYFLVGHLNSATGFLVSIVVGNGINFGIIFMARYLEARRLASAKQSVITAARATWLPTLTAAGTAAGAYGSLSITDFRGFKHFGLIGGSGMLLCWIATFLFLPAILLFMERVWPVRDGPAWLVRLRSAYGRPFAFLAGNYPRAITLGGALLTLVAGVLAYRYVAEDPMEYDMANIRNRPNMQESDAKRLGRRADKIVGGQGQDGIAIMVERREHAQELQAALHARRDAAPKEKKPFDEVVTLWNLLPKDQEAKIPLIESARRFLDRANEQNFLADSERTKLDELLPKLPVRALGIDDLPEQVARPFIEKDGTRGRLVYIVSTTGRSVWDARYLIEWADSFRTTTLSDGTVVKGSGQSVIYADMILAVVSDAPKAILLSCALTLLIVLVAFRAGAAAFWVLLALGVGLTWMLAVLAVWKTTFSGAPLGFAIDGLKLNFLNFVTLPITIGVGADYAVNVVQRHREGGGRDVQTTVIETGGAVILCSLTTTLGYWALTFSVNQAIQSFGVAAAAGEICCTLVSVLLLPAALVWIERRRANKRADAAATVC